MSDMTLQEYFAGLEYQPVDTIPWEGEDRDELPSGLVFRWDPDFDGDNVYTLIGDNIEGRCSIGLFDKFQDNPWVDEVDDKAGPWVITGWAWVVPNLTGEDE